MLKGFLSRVLNIVYPKSCLTCQNPLGDNAVDDLLCPGCWQSIKKNTPPLCAICGRQIRGAQIHKKVCTGCQRRNFYFDRVISPCIYEGVIRELIHKFKYQNKDHLSRVFSKILVESINQYRITLNLFDLVMPIPLHK
ncbi:MAG: double zinc ribbon domain-containing protein, partial [Candidatus Omnitrophota bacterium]